MDALNALEHDIGAVLIFLKEDYYSLMACLNFDNTNNITDMWLASWDFV